MSDDTSEKIYDIVAQPPDTCPLINEVINEIDKCSKAMLRRDRYSDDPKALMDMLEEADSCLYGLTSTMEDIRRNVINIRRWGQEWKSLAKDQIPEPIHEDA